MKCEAMNHNSIGSEILCWEQPCHDGRHETEDGITWPREDYDDGNVCGNCSACTNPGEQPEKPAALKGSLLQQAKEATTPEQMQRIVTEAGNTGATIVLINEISQISRRKFGYATPRLPAPLPGVTHHAPAVGVRSLTITVTPDDFDALYDHTAQIVPGQTIHHDGRFIPEPSHSGALMYRFANYANLLIARSYLEAIQQPHHQARDENGGWTLCTDWASPSHKN